MHNFIIELMQLGASLPREELLRIVEISPLVDHITDGAMAEAVHQASDRRFTESMDRVGEVHFVDLIVDAGTVSQLKSISCLLTNPQANKPPVLLTL
jgi:hypothetical protein